MPSRFGLLVAMSALACTQKNPSWCDHASDCGAGLSCDLPSHTCVVGGTVDASAGCTRDDQCTPGHCLSGSCVECASPSDCSDGHLCDTGTHTCAPCMTDSQCDLGGYPQGACLDGGCKRAQDVAAATCWLFNAQCPGEGSLLHPFCNPGDAIDAGRPYVVLVPGFCTYGPMQIQDKHLELYGRGMSIKPTDQNNGNGLSIRGTANVGVHDLGVDGSSTSNTHNGILVDSGAVVRLVHVTVHDMPDAFSAGIQANQATSLTVQKSLVYHNKGWGLLIQDTNIYDVENSFFVANGNTTVSVNGGTGGVRLVGNAGGTMGLFAYDTVSQNLSLGTVGAGISCTSLSTGVVANIVNSLAPDNDVTVNCMNRNSVYPTTPARDPTRIFVDLTRPQDSLMPCKGFHVDPMGTQAADVIGKGAALPSIADDVDGDARATPPTVGADEPAACP